MCLERVAGALRRAGGSGRRRGARGIGWEKADDLRVKGGFRLGFSCIFHAGRVCGFYTYGWELRLLRNM